MHTEVGNIHRREEGSGERKDVGGCVAEECAISHLLFRMPSLDSK